MTGRGVIRVAFLALLALLLMLPPAGRGYVEAPMSLGAVLQQSTTIVLMQVEKVDRTSNVIVYRKVRDLKGKHPVDVIKHNIGRGGLRPGEWKVPMDWAEPGKLAVFFHNGGASETCIDMYWYQAYAGGEWWNHSHGEPYLLRSYAGAPAKLAGLVEKMVAGQEVVAPCMLDGDKNAFHTRQGRIQRLRASLKLLDYNPKRDFVGWGGEDFRRVAGMPPFSHLSLLGQVGSEAQGISVVDLDGDGRMDFCLTGAGKLSVLQNAGEALNEVSLPVRGGARAAVWADYNGDGRPDLLLATPRGPRLLTSQGEAFRDDSHLIPAGPGCTPTAAAWLDHDRDGKPDLLLSDGYHGLRLYRNLGKLTQPELPPTPRFGPWRYLGPFDNTGSQGFDRPHPVEQQVDLTKNYPGKNGQNAAWKERAFKDGQVNSLLGLFQPPCNENALVYLYREIEVGRPTTVPVSLGSDDTLSVWLNGERLLAENVYRAAAPDQARLELKLRQGKNHLLLKVCQGTGDWGFYFSAPGQDTNTPQGVWFEDVSVAAGLGPEGVGAGLKCCSLTVADFNEDGRPDILHGAGRGMLLLGQQAEAGAVRYAAAKDTGLGFEADRAGPVPGDFNGDGHLDLFVPQMGASKLYQGTGKGTFVDVTARAGALAQPLTGAACAAWGDLDSDGHLDLVVGCLRGTSRFLRNKGDGTFEDRTEAVGLHRHIYNTQALALADLNSDGALDLILNNVGQDSVVLLGSRDFAQKSAVLLVEVAGTEGVVGSQVRVLDDRGQTVAVRQVGGGEARGSQQDPRARLVLTPGAYRVEVVYSSGARQARDVVLEDKPTRLVVGEKVAAMAAGNKGEAK